MGTIYDTDFNFSGADTYAMPDTVLHIVKEGEEDKVDHSFDELFLSTVRTNMTSAGYTEIALDTANLSDVVLLVTAASSSQSGAIWNSGWWGGWGWWPGWGYYPPGYPGYPGYPGGGYPVYYSYSVGSLLITMVDPYETDIEEKTFVFPWLAAVNGLLKGSSGEKRITDGINQAFEQSPYLSTN